MDRMVPQKVQKSTKKPLEITNLSQFVTKSPVKEMGNREIVG